MKRLLLALYLLLPGASLAEPGWEGLTATESVRLAINTGGIRKVTYPMGAAGNIVGVLTPKVCREVWIRVSNLSDGQIVTQNLWVFDCAGRAGQLAVAGNLLSRDDYDHTASAQSIGVERYMQRIPPGSIYATAETKVCKK